MNSLPTGGVITVNKETDVLQIHDQYRWMLIIQRVFYLFFVANAIVILLNLGSGFEASLFDWIWIAGGIAAIPLLFRSLQKRTSSSEIPFAHLQKIRKKSYWGNTVLQLHLENDKVREVHKSLSKQDMEFLRKIIGREAASKG